MNQHYIFSKLKFKNQKKYRIECCSLEGENYSRDGNGYGEWEYGDVGCGDGVNNNFFTGDSDGTIDRTSYDFFQSLFFKILIVILNQED